MKYVKPLKLYQELVKKNAMKKDPFKCHRLLGLEIFDTHLNFAVSNTENKIAVPLCTVDRQENDMELMVDKFQTLISEHKAKGFIVRFPYQINLAKPCGAARLNLTRNFVDDLCKTRKLKGVKYTYWEDLLTLKDMDFLLKYNVGFICKHLNLPSSKEIMDDFAVSRVLQGYLDCVNLISEIDNSD